MSMVQTTVRTTTCDLCKITATFEVTQAGVAEAVVAANPWLATGRLVQTTDGRNLFYCSDKCEVDAVATGVHNKPEEKKVVAEGNSQAVQIAAAIAAQREAANKALHEGTGTKVTL